MAQPTPATIEVFFPLDSLQASFRVYGKNRLRLFFVIIRSIGLPFTTVVRFESSLNLLL